MANSESAEIAKRGTVIVLEDAEPARNVIKFYLEKNNFSVLGFSNGEEALKYIGETKIENLQMILADIMMPKISGLEFVKKLKAENKFSGVPIFIMTAMSDKENVVEAKNLGVTGYVLKPVSIKKLVQILTKVYPNESFKSE